MSHKSQLATHYSSISGQIDIFDLVQKARSQESKSGEKDTLPLLYCAGKILGVHLPPFLAVPCYSQKGVSWRPNVPLVGLNEGTAGGGGGNITYAQTCCYHLTTVICVVTLLFHNESASYCSIDSKIMLT